MEEWIFYLSLALAAFSIVGFLILSVAGSFIERRVKGEKAAKRAARISNLIAFALFLLLGFSAVPIMIGAFFPLLDEVVPIDISMLRKNDLAFVFLFWTAYIIGLAILLPVIKKDFFGAPEEKTAPGDAGAKRPASDRPPLDRMIEEADTIVLANTQMKGEAAAYTVVDVWKAPREGFTRKKGGAVDVSTRALKAQGYAPVDRQLIVLFFSRKPPHGVLVEILPVIGEYVMYAPADTSVQEYLALGDLKKRVLNPKS